jgi:hypothetical protein
MTGLSHRSDGRAGQTGSKLVDQEEPAAAEPAGRWAGLNRQYDWLGWPWLQGLAALVIYMVLWVTTSARPLLNNASWAQLDQRSMDPNFYIWCLRWWPYAISHGMNPLYTHQVGAPVGYALAWVTTVPPLALLASPVTATYGPVAAFNLLTAVALPLSAWAAFMLCRRLTHRFWAALVGGAVFGFCAYNMNHAAAGQLNLTFSLLLPLMGYLVVAWRDKGLSDRAFVIWLGVTMAAQFYLFLETFADLTALLVVALALGFLLAGRSGRSDMARLSKLVGFGYLIAIVLAGPYLGYALTLPEPQQPTVVSGLDLASLVVPRPGQPHTLGWPWLEHVARHQVLPSQAGYVGVPLVLIVLLFAVLTWSSKLTRFLTCMLVFIIVAAFGSALYIDGHREFGMPWASVWNLPILRNAYPLRLMVFAYLVLAVVTALFLAGPAKRLWARWPLAVLVVAAIVLDTPPLGIAPKSHVPTYISDALYRRDLRPGEIVVVVSTTGNAGMLWQAESDFYMRLAGGYINQAITRRSDLPAEVQALAQASPANIKVFESYIKQDKVGAILLDIKYEPKWVGIFWRLGFKGSRLGNVYVYYTHDCSACRALNWSQLHTHIKVPWSAAH